MNRPPATQRPPEPFSVHALNTCWAILGVLLSSTLIATSAPLWASPKDCLATFENVLADHAGSISTTRHTLPNLLNVPSREQGEFVHTLDGINSYYQSHPMTAGLFTLESPPETMRDLGFKVNDRGDFQFESWHINSVDILSFQAAWGFQIPDFIDRHGGSDLLEAKINFFTPLHYHPSEFHYERPYAYMKEWGELPHPPVQKLAASDIASVNRRFSPDGASETQLRTSAMNTAAFHRALDEKTHSELTIGNQMQILMDSDSTEVKKQLIKKAKKSIFVSSLVFVNDPSTMEIVDLLIEKARQNVEVRVLAEGSLSWLHGSVLRKLRQNNIQVVYANDFFAHNSSVVYHTKIVAIDNEEVVMGGQNMLDADLAAKGTDFKNRDADIYIKGPAATDVIWNFTQDWNYFTNKFRLRKWATPFTDEDLQILLSMRQEQRDRGLRGSQHYDNWFSNPAELPRGTGRFIGQSPYNNIETITEAHTMYLEATRKYFVLTNPHIFDTHSEDKPRGWRLTHKRFKNFNRLFLAMREKLSDPDGYEMDLLTTGGDFATNEASPMVEIMTREWLQQGKVFRSNLLFLLLRWGNKKLFKLTHSLIQQDWLPHKNARIWAHQSYLHSKIWYFDRMAVSLGSLNLHFNATDHSYEATFITHDRDVLRDAEHVLATDMANSIPFTK